MLEEAGIREAAAVVVAADRDDAAVLVTLTARELNPTATVVASARESENIHALKHSGADSVILSSGAAGQLLGQAVHSPQLVGVLEDLLAVGQGLDLVECPVQQPASLAEFSKPGPVLGVVRDGRLLRFDDERVSDLKPGDRVICLSSEEGDPQPV